MDNLQLASSLRSAVSALHKGLRRQMSSVNRYSMTEMETIGHLSRSSGMLPTELATLTRVKTQSMSQILKAMEEQKLIKRTPSKEDRRKVIISLTPHGRNLVEKLRYDKDKWLKTEIETSLNEKEKELLIRVLPVLNKIVKTK
jgi:DNA-binding MarR family transcriptional regulator